MPSVIRGGDGFDSSNGLKDRHEAAVPLLDDGNVMQTSHGFGQKPFMHQVSLRCVAENASYQIGDEIPYTGFHDGDGARRGSTWCDSTNIYFEYGYSGLMLYNETTQVVEAVVLSSWEVVFRAIK
jgi:hypothetical protein